MAEIVNIHYRIEIFPVPECHLNTDISVDNKK